MTEKKMLKCGDIRISFGTIQSAFKSWIQSTMFERCTSQMKLFIQFEKPCLYLFADTHLSMISLGQSAIFISEHPARFYFGTPCPQLFWNTLSAFIWDTLPVFILGHPVSICFGTPCPYLFWYILYIFILGHPARIYLRRVGVGQVFNFRNSRRWPFFVHTEMEFQENLVGVYKSISVFTM